MNNIIVNWTKLKKITEETTKVPFTYLIFILLSVLIYSGKGQNISEIVTSNYIIKQILVLLTELLSLIYNNYIAIFVAIVLAAILILVLFWKTSVFNILPNDIEYTDGTVISWNPVSAAQRLFNLIVNLSTDCFICYYLLNFIINTKYFEVKYYLIFFKNSEIDNLLNILMVVNYIILLSFVLKALFVIKYKDTKRWLKFSSEYEVISSFSVSSEDDTIQYIVARDGYTFTNYYLLQVQTHKRQLKEMKGGLSIAGDSSRQEYIKEEIPLSKRSYRILDKGENLSDIVYYYDELKKKYFNVPD
ncbi:hypothetical protein MK546_07115 [Streptococcus cristatus]|uniref:Uncharacterized protein n=1 Tax=Streptococcus cristatus TaxID=45634 RepID=A0AAW5WNP8_STRCR|nr:hypothetical protein [Streptococcus cristatus]MCY7221849.1 hypothetical protein [Streptococcus cristatus]